MNIVVGSAFRNSEARVPAYMRQVGALQRHARLSDVRHTVRCVAAVGDTVDGTLHALKYHAFEQGVPVDIVECSHGGPVFGSTEATERMAALSRVGNAILDGVRETDDVLVYVESDLLWTPDTIGALIDRVLTHPGNVIAPLVFAGAHFYDIWAFRKNGTRFAPFPPYHADLAPTGLTRVDSVGSCLVMGTVLARDTRVRMESGALVEWCTRAREHGYQIWTHADFRVEHPA